MGGIYINHEVYFKENGGSLLIGLVWRRKASIPQTAKNFSND
jgi:hypothetical protein